MKNIAPTYLKHQFLIAMPHMADPNFAQTLTYITVLGTIMIAVLRGSFVYAQEIFGNTYEVAFNRKQTKEAITTVRKTLSRGIAFARKNRMSKITIESGKNWDHTQTWYQLSDPYAQTYQGYQVSTDFTGTSAADAHSTVTKDQSVYTNQFAGPTFDALFQPVSAEHVSQQERELIAAAEASSLASPWCHSITSAVVRPRSLRVAPSDRNGNAVVNAPLRTLLMRDHSSPEA